MYFIAPADLVAVPLALWSLAGIIWFSGRRDMPRAAGFLVCVVIAFGAHFALPGLLDAPKIAVSDYKPVSYARKFPDSARIYSSVSPFGQIEVYSSSYLHFAPGLSDNAAFALPNMPANSYLGLYVDSDGPSGIIRDLEPERTAYFRYLPMYYPYLLKTAPQTFVVQFGGGLSTEVALRSGSAHVAVAEANPAVLEAFRAKVISDFTGDILSKVEVIPYEGRLHLAATQKKYDVIDFSLANSAGLSAPGGFAIVEKFGYAREAMSDYMRALGDGGVLSVTLWNKEEPPKSVLKLYATMAQAARALGRDDISNNFFVVSNYLATATVLFKQDGFTPDEIEILRKHTRALSFDEIYYPGMPHDGAQDAKLLADYRNQIFAAAADPTASAQGDPTVGDPGPDEGAGGDRAVLPSVSLGRLAWRDLVDRRWADFERDYTFDARPLTNDRPYFAAYLKPADAPRVLDRLEMFQDEWGYLLLWATLGVAATAASALVILPLVFGWRAIFSHCPGKGGTVLYFACLGLGYIMVEVGLIAHFVLALSNAAISASILITGMLAFSGLGSLVSERVLSRSRQIMPLIFAAIALLLVGYGLFVDRALIAIGGAPYGWRLVLCFLLIGPPAFCMGFPMPVAMTSLGRLGKKHMFLWAWGANGCFSVIGAAAAPILATSFGAGSVLIASACAYLIAAPAFFAVLAPMQPTTEAPQKGLRKWMRSRLSVSAPSR